MPSSRDVLIYYMLAVVLLRDVCPESRGAADRLLDEGMEDFFSQRAVIPDIPDLKAMGQSEVTNFRSDFIPRAFGPRSMRPEMEPHIIFPPANPNKGNLHDICRFSQAPVRYPKDTLPRSGFGYVHRQAEAVNTLQGFYGVCCGINGTQEKQLCCATQAWKKALSKFCSEEFTIKTSHYPCCKKNRKPRWSCFEKNAGLLHNSVYNISFEVMNVKSTQKIRGFKYNDKAC